MKSLARHVEHLTHHAGVVFAEGHESINRLRERTNLFHRSVAVIRQQVIDENIITLKRREDGNSQFAFQCGNATGGEDIAQDDNLRTHVRLEPGNKPAYLLSLESVLAAQHG